MASRPRWLVRGSLRAGSVVGPLGPDRGFSVLARDSSVQIKSPFSLTGGPTGGSCWSREGRGSCEPSMAPF